MKDKNDLDLIKHIQLGKFVILILLLIAAYNFFIEIIDNNYISNEFTSLSTTPMLLFFSIPVFIYLKKSKLPMTLFGFNMNNARKNIIESVTWSIVFCLIATLIKLYLIKETKILNDSSIIEINIFLKRSGSNFFGISYMLTYVICAILQTIGCNGFVQSSIKNLTKNKYAILGSIFSSTLLFSSFHVDLNFMFAIIVIPALLFWGIMYNKQNSLVGVSISHIIIGTWVLFILNFHDFLKALN